MAEGVGGSRRITSQEQEQEGVEAGVTSVRPDDEGKE